ncbi:MAG: hypothetical protein ABIT38_06235 [Gemmatimonadaceae bacterium]
MPRTRVIPRTRDRKQHYERQRARQLEQHRRQQQKFAVCFSHARYVTRNARIQLLDDRVAMCLARLTTDGGLIEVIRTLWHDTAEPHNGQRFRLANEVSFIVSERACARV